jgi:hypothetical protein
VLEVRDRRQPLLDRVHGPFQVVGALGVERPARIAADDVARPGRQEDPRDGHPGRTEAADDDPDLLDPLPGQRQRVQQRREHDDRRTVLVVVEDGDIELGLQPVFDLEASRS